MKKRSRRQKLTPEEQRWERQFAVLAKFKHEHSHCFVLPKQDGNIRLAKWSAEQRAMWRSGELIPTGSCASTNLGLHGIIGKDYGIGDS
jgi:hypothetical protein